MPESIQSLSAFFEHELKDIYDAEHKLVEALRKLSNESADPTIARAFASHLKETQGHIERLDLIFDMLHMEPSRGEGCAGIDGLLEEKRDFSQNKPTREILQIFNLTAAQKTERYEITAYEGLVQLATHLQLDDAAELLRMTLDEEYATLDKLQEFASAPATARQATAPRHAKRG